MWYFKMIISCVTTTISMITLVNADVTIHREGDADQSILKVSNITLEETAEKKVSLHIFDDEKKNRFTLSMSNAELNELAKEITTRLDYRKETVLDTNHPFYQQAAARGPVKIERLSVSECRTFHLDQAAQHKDLHAKAYFCYIGTSDNNRLIIDNIQLAVGSEKMIYLLLLLTDKDAKSLVTAIDKRT
ncbi:MAG: hypothetical protein UW94_C0001G0021 [Parcubacteria group bacterium GW2011_GWA2_45_14]|nr:MAG: hypothetical protein UW94_C0001G0021 [Parcubacteria group bacterium GW2011_GWA2_45_14]